MADGQDKSDDLIAELAKLMASNAGSAETEAKPAPRLVTLPDADNPQAAPGAPAPGPTIRIPGMDAPSGPASPLPIPPAAQSPQAAPTIRIPGMDQRAAEPAPPVSAPVAAPAVSAPTPEARPASVDFGTLPPASTSFKPEPLANWQDREIPKPVPSRPAPIEAPQPAPAVEAEAKPAPQAPQPRVEAEPAVPRPAEPLAQAPRAFEPNTPRAFEPSAPRAFEPTPPRASEPVPPRPSEPVVGRPSEPSAPVPRPAAPVVAEPMVAAAKASPSTDSFDFDFGFGTEPPAPIAASDARPQSQPQSPPRPATPAPAPSAAPSSDPIADLIAAELDAADPIEPETSIPPVLTARPTPAPAPAARSVTAPLAMNPQSRPGGPSPFRPAPSASASSAPQGQAPSSPRGEDRFGVAPVFGPGGRATSARPPQPAVERDPMDEIESLIGEAVRVELTSEAPAQPAAPAAPQPQPAPVVPPLTTGFAPRRAAIKETEPQVPSAEAAILAAAAASGAEVGRLDGITAEPNPYKRPKAKPERRRLMAGSMRQYVGMAVAGTLLLAAGFGLYWVLGMGRGDPADAPVLQADATPVKETPPPAPATNNSQGSVVFGELDGTQRPAADEQLVSRDGSAETSVADVATPVGDEAGADAAATESELANRKVRTVTVRPDGTIVSGDDAVAGNETLPVDRPAVPDLPGADVQPSELLAAVPSANATPAATDPIAAAIADPEAAAATGPAPTVDPSIVAPVPLARPTDRSALGGGANQRTAAASPAAVDLTGAAAATPAAPAASAAAPVSTGGGAYVQLSSQPTEADAQASLRATQSRLSGILGGRSLAIRQVNLGARGTWFRVVLPVGSFSEATQACASLKANGVDCLPIGG